MPTTWINEFVTVFVSLFHLVHRLHGLLPEEAIIRLVAEAAVNVVNGARATTLRIINSVATQTEVVTTTGETQTGTTTTCVATQTDDVDDANAVAAAANVTEPPRMPEARRPEAIATLIMRTPAAARGRGRGRGILRFLDE